VAGIGVATLTLVEVSRVPENVRETTVLTVPEQTTSEPTSGVRRKFCSAEVEVVLLRAP
jgi:hypothetical protein